MVANLPYNVGTPLIIEALRRVPVIERFVVLLQKEVAARLVAGGCLAAAPALPPPARSPIDGLEVLPEPVEGGFGLPKDTDLQVLHALYTELETLSSNMRISNTLSSNMRTRP